MTAPIGRKRTESKHHWSLLPAGHWVHPLHAGRARVLVVERARRHGERVRERLAQRVAAGGQRAAAAVRAREAVGDGLPEHAPQVLRHVAPPAVLVGAAEVVAVVVRLVVEREHAVDGVEERGAHLRLELGLEQPRPPGVHDLDRVRRGRTGRPGRGRSRWAPESTQSCSVLTAAACCGSLGVPTTWSSSGSTCVPRRSTVPATSIESITSGRLILPAPAIRWSISLVERLRAVVRAVAPLVVGGVVAGRLLVVPGGDVVLVDHLRVLLEGRVRRTS